MCLSPAPSIVLSSLELEVQAAGRRSIFFISQQPTVMTSAGAAVSHLVWNTSTTEIVTLHVTNQTRVDRNPTTHLMEMFFYFFSVGCAVEKHSSPVLFLTNPPAWGLTSVVSVGENDRKCLAQSTINFPDCILKASWENITHTQAGTDFLEVNSFQHRREDRCRPCGNTCVCT